MTFAIVLVLTLIFSTHYLFNQWRHWTRRESEIWKEESDEV